MLDSIENTWKPGLDFQPRLGYYLVSNKSRPMTMIDKRKEYTETARAVAILNGRGRGRVMTRMLAARIICKLGAQDFMLYNLDAKPARSWKEYLTKTAMDNLQAEVNPVKHKGLVTDKVLFYERCLARDISTPPVLAVIAAYTTKRSGVALQTVETATQLNDLLRGFGNRTLIIKDQHGAWGKGVLLVSVRDGRIIQHTGEEFTADEIIRHCLEHQADFIVQDFLRADDRVKSIMPGPALGTFRMVTVSQAEGAEVAVPYAFAKIPVAGNITDNFYHGSTGNLICGIQVETGRLMTAWGANSGKHGQLVEVDTHPNTGLLLPGFEIPSWAQMLAAAKRAAAAFPELRTLGWDVALTSDGIVMLEANCNYDPDGPQITLNRGIRSEIARHYKWAMGG
jgi:Sugar-transfer associated ATP-grasp